MSSIPNQLLIPLRTIWSNVSLDQYTLLTRLQLCRYTGVGHLGPMEDPDFVAARMLRSLLAAQEPAAWAHLGSSEHVARTRL